MKIFGCLFKKRKLVKHVKMVVNREKLRQAFKAHFNVEHVLTLKG